MTSDIDLLLSNYNKCKQDLKDVSKGGKDYDNCSFMDISTRADRLKESEQKLIIALGTKELNELEELNELNNQGN